MLPSPHLPALLASFSLVLCTERCSPCARLQVGGAAIVSWAFSELRDKRFDEELGASLAWEALYAAINKTIARTQVRAALLHVEHAA